MYPKKNEKSSIKSIHRLFWASLNYIALVKVFDTMQQSVCSFWYIHTFN